LAPGEAGPLVGFGVGCLPGELVPVSPVATTHGTNIRLCSCGCKGLRSSQCGPAPITGGPPLTALADEIRPPRHPPTRRAGAGPPQPGPAMPTIGAEKITRCLTGSPWPLATPCTRLPVLVSTSAPRRRRRSSLVNAAMDPACGTSVAASLETARRGRGHAGLSPPGSKQISAMN
jgi:hypothetical protein